jgi:hypothetical protein
MGEFDHLVAAIEASPITAAFKLMVDSDDFSSLDKNAAKRHHFVPQFLLRGFAETRTGKDALWQMNTRSRRAPIRVDIGTAASRRRYYAVPDEDGTLSNRNEGYLALVEEHAAPALRHLVEEPETLSQGERATIAFFVALQTMRTPAAEQQMIALANAAFQNWASEFYSDRRAFAERHREHFGQGASEDEIEQFRQEMISQVRDGRLRVGGREAALSTGLVHAIENVPMLIEFDWTLLRAPQGGFITSDRAFAIHDPAPRFPWSAQALLSSDMTETTIPLSDEACLLMRPQPMGCRLTVRDAAPSEVETINLRTFGWADEYVFGSSQAALVGLRLATRRRPADVVRPKPFAQVIGLEPDPEDSSLARANLQRGFPAQLLNAKGELRDYIIVPCDTPHPELRALADELAERRARKRARVGSDEPMEGRLTHSAVHALDDEFRAYRASSDDSRSPM